MADTADKNHFPTSFKIILACLLILLIVAGGSLEYLRPQQSVTVTTTEFVTQAPVTVTRAAQSVVGGVQINSSISFSGVGKTQYPVFFTHSPNLIVALVVVSQYALGILTVNGTQISPLAEESNSSGNTSPFALYVYRSHNTTDLLLFKYPSIDTLLMAAMAFKGHGSLNGIENYGVSQWSSVNPFTIVQGAGSIAGRMNAYFAVTFTDASTANVEQPQISLDRQITQVGSNYQLNAYFQTISRYSRFMFISFGYIPSDSDQITTSYTFENAGVGAVAFVGIDPS
jgi:hypothetical protein